MPKPRSGKVIQWEVRITPMDGNPITQEEFSVYHEYFTKFILFEEGPEQNKKLHYHGYLESEFSDSKLRPILRKLSHCEDQTINGNALYFTSKPHEHTWGYISKYGKCVLRHGESQTTIDEWITKSNQYKKDKSRDTKRKQRTREDELRSVVEQVEKDLHNDSSIRYVGAIVQRVLDICHQENIRFPTRSQMDQYVLKLIYPYDNEVVRSYYTKFFSQY